MSRSSTARPLDPFVLEALAWTGAAVDTLRVSTHSLSTEPTDAPANTYYPGVIIDPGTIKWSIFDGNATSGKASIDYGFIELMNPDGALDAWFNYQFGRSATLKMLASKTTPITGATVLYTGTIVGIETSDALHSLRLRMRSRMVELDVPLLTNRYAGTTTSLADSAEGDTDLKDQIKPYIYGSTPNVRPKFVNKFNLLYQFADNAVASIVLYDGAIPLTNSGDFGSLAALCNATIPAGSYATCLALGMVRLGADPAFAVTGDVVEGATLADRSAARVIQRMLALVSTISTSDIDTAAFDAFHAFNPAEVGIVIDGDVTALDQISKIADSVGGVPLQDPTTGDFTVEWITGPAAVADASFVLRDLLDGSGFQLFAGPSSEGQGVPAWSVIVNWGRVWSTMSTGDLAPRIAEATDGADLARKNFLATTVRQTQAQDSAVKTANPQAVELTFDTLLTTEADAVAEAARRLALYKVRRDRITFPTFFDRGEIALGRTVKLTMNRLGYGAGKNFLVLGREDNFKRKTRTLTLWG